MCCHSDWVAVMNISLSFGDEQFPRDLPILPLHWQIGGRSLVSLRTLLDFFVLHDIAEFPHSIPGLILFDAVDNVVVCHDFLTVTIDQTLEFDKFGMRLHAHSVFVDHFHDLCSDSGTVFLRWHEEGLFQQFLWRWVSCLRRVVSRHVLQLQILWFVSWPLLAGVTVERLEVNEVFLFDIGSGSGNCPSGVLPIGAWWSSNSPTVSSKVLAAWSST